MLNVQDLRISLDRREQGSNVDFVSHAHSDHFSAAKSSKAMLASEQTVQLIEAVQNTALINLYNGNHVHLADAGHMLGSKQLYIDNEEEGRITYSGDFQMEKSKTSSPIEIVDTDSLILDSTYHWPSLRFDSKREVEVEMQDWVARKLKEGIVLFSAYAMGKAQELIAIFNEIGIKPVVSKKVSTISRVYTRNGVRLDYASAYDEGSDYESVLKGNFLGVTETRALQELKHMLEIAYNKKVFTAVATGFAKIFRFDTDEQFALSDHADFTQSVDYINATNAKKIYTYGHSADKFAANLAKIGYNARPFSLIIPTIKKI